MTTLQQYLDQISPIDEASREQATHYLSQLTMPHWALGQLLDVAVDLAGISGSITPTVVRKRMVVMAADHGVTAEGVSAFPAEVTPQMVANFVAGGAGINAIAAVAGADVTVVDMGVNADLSALHSSDCFVDRKIAMGTVNMAQQSAMTVDQATQALLAGIELVVQTQGETDLWGTGDMGIGNTTAAAAITAVVTGVPVAQAVGRGTGIDDTGLAIKIAVVNRAIVRNKPDAQDGLDILHKIGGFELAGIAGVILGAAITQKPVLIDGYISTAAALIAAKLAPAAVGYMIAAHKSVEPGHIAALDFLGKSPLLDLGFRLGEGTGAAMAMPLIDAAASMFTKVATFESAGVSERE